MVGGHEVHVGLGVQLNIGFAAREPVVEVLDVDVVGRERAEGDEVRAQVLSRVAVGDAADLHIKIGGARRWRRRQGWGLVFKLLWELGQLVVPGLAEVVLLAIDELGIEDDGDAEAVLFVEEPEEDVAVGRVQTAGVLDGDLEGSAHEDEQVVDGVLEEGLDVGVASAHEVAKFMAKIDELEEVVLRVGVGGDSVEGYDSQEEVLSVVAEDEGLIVVDEGLAE